MGKWISITLSGFVGLALAAFTAWGVVSSQTAAPAKNPASQQIIDYGTR